MKSVNPCNVSHICLTPIPDSDHPFQRLTNSKRYPGHNNPSPRPTASIRAPLPLLSSNGPALPLTPSNQTAHTCYTSLTWILHCSHKDCLFRNAFTLAYQKRQATKTNETFSAPFYWCPSMFLLGHRRLLYLLSSLIYTSAPDRTLPQSPLILLGVIYTPHHCHLT